MVNHHEIDKELLKDSRFFQCLEQQFQHLFVAKGVKVTHHNIGEMLKGVFNVLHIHIVVGEIDNLTVIFIFGLAVDARDSLNGVNAADFFIEKQGM